MAVLGSVCFDQGSYINGIKPELSAAPTGSYSTVQRHYGYGYSLVTNASSVISATPFPSWSNATSNATSVASGYWYWPNSSDLPNSGQAMCLIAICGYIQVILNSSGQLKIYDGNSAIDITGYSTDAVAIGSWNRIELQMVAGAANSVTYFALKLNGKVIVSASYTKNVSGSASSFGHFSVAGFTAASSGKTVYMDDLLYTDNSSSTPALQDSSDNWRPGDYACGFSMVTADVQRGSWTGGVGGTTNLYDALNNDPPIGTATETDLTQIESADSTGNNSTDEYVGTLGSSLATLGLPNRAKYVTIEFGISHGEDINTNTKTGSFGLSSSGGTYNGGYNTFTYGNDGGALGTWPTGWVSAAAVGGTAVETINADETLRIMIRKTDSGSRVASVCAAWTKWVAAVPDVVLEPKPMRIFPSVPVQDRSRW